MSAPLGSKFSFTFSKKKSTTVLTPSVLGQQDAKDKEPKIIKESISTFDSNTLSRKLDQKEELVIPLLNTTSKNTLFKQVANDPSLLEKGNSEYAEAPRVSEPDVTDLSLEQRAEKELINESLSHAEKWESQIATAAHIRIENTAANGLADGDISNIDDYESVSVDHYGAALLRGMGWKKDGGIGKDKFKRVVDVVEPVAGVTLGEVKKAKVANNNTEDELELVKGCYVVLHSGRHKGTYGVVESVDCDHILVRPALGGSSLLEVEANVKVVSKSEFASSSRVINKDMYDKYKEKEGAENKSEQNDQRDRDIEKVDCKEQQRLGNATEGKMSKFKERMMKYESRVSQNSTREDVKNEAERGRYEMHERTNPSDMEKKKDIKSSPTLSRETSPVTDQDKLGQKQVYDDRRKDRKSKVGYDHYKHTSGEGGAPLIPWIREGLRVRIVSKSYKKGKYFREKVVVQSIETVESCTCVSEEGKTLRDVHPDVLETVIPKDKMAKVMIVGGKNKGHRARILEFHREKEKATVQLISDSSIILKLHYEDICDYANR